MLGTGAPLTFSTRTGVLEQLTPDPDGEVTITVPEREHDQYATVLADRSRARTDRRPHPRSQVVEAGS